MSREKVEVTTPFIKLDSFLKFCGACDTGGEAKGLVQGGYVFVNSERCEARGKKLVHGDIVRIDDYEFEVVKVEG